MGLTLFAALACTAPVAAQPLALAHAHVDDQQLPAVLTPSDAMRYRQAFEAQRRGDIAEATRLIASVGDRALVGVVLAERYLAPRARVERADLVRWLAQYGDHAAAPQVFHLARRLGATAGAAPTAVPAITGGSDEDGGWRDRVYRSTAPVTPEQTALERRIRAALRDRNPGAALDLLQSLRSIQAIDPVQVDVWRADVAMHLFAAGQDREALLLATSAARSVQHVPQAAWVAGLAAWRLDRKPEALRQFTAAFGSPAASAWTRAAAGFWAARAADATRQERLKLQWLERAADIGPNFYSLLARHRLGRPLVEDWSLPIIGISEVQAFADAPGFWRALALTQIDQVALAEAELRRAFPQAPRELQPLALTIAERGGMPTLAMRLAQRVEHTHGVRYAAASYPLPPWMPSGGYQIDPALVFAIMRQESQFEPAARSHAGALGLMQLMPGTARAMAGDPKLSSQTLRDPQRNIGLGERLLDYLLTHDRVRGNLLNLAVAYNGGEGTLARLQASVRHQDDPLLFLEAIPIAETRLFAERMIANYWIYQVRLASEAPSVAEMGAGRWPAYRAPALVAQSNSRSPADARN